MHQAIIQPFEAVFGQRIARNKRATAWAIVGRANEYGQWCWSGANKGTFRWYIGKGCQQLHHQRSSKWCQGILVFCISFQLHKRNKCIFLSLIICRNFDSTCAWPFRELKHVVNMKLLETCFCCRSDRMASFGRNSVKLRP